MERTITVIIPSLNEEGNIENTFTEVLEAIDDRFSDHEILLFDDGSTDRTGAIIDELAARHKNVKAIHNGKNMGFGYNFKKGVSMARMNYVSIIPGDNEILGSSIKAMFSLVGSADIVIPFTMNMEVRPFSRCLLSHLFTLILNSIFRCMLHYYNGPIIHRRDVITKVPIQTNGFAFQAMALVKLIRSGHSFVEVGMYLRPRRSSRSTALKFKNVVSVFGAIARLFWEVCITNRNQYSVSVQRVMPQKN